MSDNSWQFATELIEEFTRDFYVPEGNQFGGQRAYAGVLFALHDVAPEQFDETVEVLRLVAVKKGLKASKVAQTERHVRTRIASASNGGN